MRIKALLTSFCAISLVAVSHHLALAQAAPGVFSDANHPSGAPDPQKLDSIWSVDPINDQVSIKVPFPSTPEGGRGPKVPFALLYNSGSTVTLQANGVVGLGYGAQGSIFTWAAHPLAFIGSLTSPSGPWTTSGPYFNSGYSVVPDFTVPDGNGGTILAGAGCTIYGPYTYVDQDGDSHDLNILGFSSSYSNPSAWAPSCGEAKNESSTYSPSSMTSDGSGMFTSAGSAIASDGTVAIPGRVTDTNSNSVALATSGGVTTATDALGRTVYVTNIPIGQPGQIPAGSYYVKTFGESGSPEIYTVIFATYTLPSFVMPHPTTSEISSPTYCTSCASHYTVNQPGGDSFTAVQEIDLPDNTSKYTFSYNSPYGTISEITFPTGGTVQFTWGIRDEDWSPYGQYEAISATVVTSAIVSDGSTQATWTYALKSKSNSSVPTGSVTAPDSSRTDYTGACFIYTLVPFYSNQAKASCKEIARAVYNSGGTLIKTIAQNFTSHGLPIQVATTLYDGPSNLQQLTQYGYDAWDNVTSQFDSDFYACSGTPCPAPTQTSNLPSPGWLRETYKAYAYTTNTALANAHIVAKPSQIAIEDYSGAPYSLINYSYDNNGNVLNQSDCLSLTGTGSGAACASGASSSWQTQYTYTPHGEVLTKTDAYGTFEAATTTNTWGGPDGSTSGNGYLIKTAYANGAADQYTYSPYTGQMISHSDWNTNVTAYDYSDPFNRLKTISAPLTVDGTTGVSAHATTSYNYSDDPGSFSVQEQRTVNSAGLASSITTYFDGLGRKTTTKTVTSDCMSPIEVDTVYDSMGRIHTVSNPYCSPSESTYGQTTYSYDALGRKVQVQAPNGAAATISYGGNASKFTDPSNGLRNPARIEQVDGLGRLVAVCELTAARFGVNSPQACNLNTTGTGYLTSYGYDPRGNLVSAHQPGMTRSFIYDAMSRLATAYNPETGTVTYTYSTPSNPCSPYPLAPCSKTDARNVTASYRYEILGRLAQKLYNDNVTPISCFRYDVGSGSNVRGHLSLAWTQPASTASCNTAPTSFLTLKSFLNFDAVGHLINATQQTCVNGICSGPSAYQVSMTYDLAGNIATLTNSVGASGQPLTLTNYFDSAARPCLTTSSWTAPASANIFQVSPGTSTPGYSPAGGLKNYSLGSSVSNASTSCATAPNSPINVAQSYTNRFWVSAISATGQIP